MSYITDFPFNVLWGGAAHGSCRRHETSRLLVNFGDWLVQGHMMLGDKISTQSRSCGSLNHRPVAHLLQQYPCHLNTEHKSVKPVVPQIKSYVKHTISSHISIKLRHICCPMNVFTIQKHGNENDYVVLLLLRHFLGDLGYIPLQKYWNRNDFPVFLPLYSSTTDSPSG